VNRRALELQFSDFVFADWAECEAWIHLLDRGTREVHRVDGAVMPDRRTVQAILPDGFTRDFVALATVRDSTGECHASEPIASFSLGDEPLFGGPMGVA